MIAASKKTRKRNGIEKELDALVRELVYARDGHRCVKCGGTRALNPSHILAKGHCKRLRWDEYNILTMCFPCHRYFWHDRPADAIPWLEQKYPGRLHQLREMAALAKKPDLKEIRMVLRAEVEKLK